MQSVRRLILLVVAVCAMRDASPLAQSSATQPNIVLIITDDVGYGDFGSYGAPDIKTPHVDGLAKADVTATLKHFPGLGRVLDNTDTTADVSDPETTAGDGQVTLFADLARSPAAPFVMVSSATYAQIDPAAQAAFSPVVVTELLRKQLGFDGVVISDDLGNARAVSALPPGERAVRFFAAGGTLLLTVDPAIVPEMIDAVLERSDSDPAFAATVDAAVRTALTAKDRAGLLTG